MKTDDNVDNVSDDVSRWEDVTQSLILVMAIFLSTIFAVAFSKGVQEATLVLSRSVFW